MTKSIIKVANKFIQKLAQFEDETRWKELADKEDEKRKARQKEWDDSRERDKERNRAGSEHYAPEFVLRYSGAQLPIAFRGRSTVTAGGQFGAIPQQIRFDNKADKYRFILAHHSAKDPDKVGPDEIKRRIEGIKKNNGRRGR